MDRENTGCKFLWMLENLFRYVSVGRHLWWLFFFFLSQQFKRVLVLFAESYPASISALPLGMIEIANHNAMGMFSEAPSDLYRNINNSFSKRSHTSVTNVQTEKLIELSGDSAFLCGVH